MNLHATNIIDLTWALNDQVIPLVMDRGCLYDIPEFNHDAFLRPLGGMD
jgi:hypothetical protein